MTRGERRITRSATSRRSRSYCRDERRVTWVHDIRQDVVYGMRMLRKHPGLTTIAVASLALGIGANAAVLGAFDALFVQGLPVPAGDRLVAIQARPSTIRVSSAACHSSTSRRTATAARRSTRSAPRSDGRAILRPMDPANRRSASSGSWSRLGGCRCSASSRSSAVCSRTPRPAGAPQPIVLSHAFWQRRFGGDRHILDRQLRIQGARRPSSASCPPTSDTRSAAIDYWAPLRVAAQPDAGARLFGVRARLKPGVSLDQAQAELDAIAAQLAAEARRTKAGACACDRSRTSCSAGRASRC